jgi:hypothetical protein
LLPVTYVIDGALEYKDCMGNTGVIRPCEIQRMRAGTGVRHSEFNPSENDPVRLIQLWIIPAVHHPRPSWEQKSFSLSDRSGKLLPIAVPAGKNGNTHSTAVPGPLFVLADTFSERARGALCYLRVALEECASMAEKLVLVGVLPEIVVIAPDEQVVWLSDTGTLKIQFDPNRCPFQSNVFQAPPGRQLQSGPPRPGINPGSYKYRLWLNDQPIGNGEVILREK